MQTVTLEVTLPKKLLAYGLDKEDVNREVGKWLVFSLFRAGRVSSGKAASLLGITRREFLELLHREGVAYFDYSEEELQAEFASVRELTPAETEQ
jgi:predicted HTH domain antitoxin